MLVVLSDLHLSEARSTQIGEMRFNRNLPAETYQAFFAEINQIALSKGINKVDFVLAGDILELSRSGFWLEGRDRPYLNNLSITTDSSAETTLMNIIKVIRTEERVAATIEAFSTLQDYFDCEVNLQYILGNHDRLVNATSAIRREVRKTFNLKGGDELFAHRFIFNDHQKQPLCLVRHGHEYDRMNFAIDLEKLDTIPTEIPEELYDSPCIGDIITIEFGAALQRYFVEMYGEDAIIADPILLTLYKRLMAFDDVRPTTALLPFLFSTPGVTDKQTWELMKPCLERVIGSIADNETIIKFIENSASLHKGQRVMFEGLIKSSLMKRGIPYWLVRQFMKGVSKQIKLDSQARWARKEALIRDPGSECRCVISGHTHVPETALISSRGGEERYYINTGTWRNIIPAAKDFEEFGMLEAMTKVIVFAPLENSASGKQPSWSFQYRSGVNFHDDINL